MPAKKNFERDMNSRSSIATPSRRNAAASSPRTPSRRHVSAQPARTPLAAVSHGRRAAASPSAASSASTRRRSPRPAWNSYLTDNAQYRLTREEHLVRKMQQLSAAHFHARASPMRRRHDEVQARSYAASEAESETPPSFVDEETDGYSDQDPRDSRRGMQNELSALERMLSDLKYESERVSELEPDGEMDPESGSYDRDNGWLAPLDANSLEDKGTYQRFTYSANDDANSAQEEEAPFSDPVANICFKSLQIGIDLTQKMHQLTHKLAIERRSRIKHEQRMQQLEQHCEAMQTQHDVWATRYEDLTSHVDATRDALIATGEALHWIRQDLSRPREHDATSTPMRRGEQK